ncbi:MAG: ATP citrate lyase citrate-binding domain-containing protein [Patescibacteria group bacterium]
MILFEHEGKELLKSAGINIPRGELLKSEKDKISISFPLVLKAQVLSGKRALRGGIVMVENKDSLSNSLKKIFNLKTFGEPVQAVLAEEKIPYKKSFYLSFSYDTNFRSAVLSWSHEGGTGVEERKVNIIPFDIRKIVFPKDMPFPVEILELLVKIFLENDCLLLEINPLVSFLDKTGKEKWCALDAKVNLDDTAGGRHKNWQYSPRNSGKVSEREIAAKKIDEGDHRGTAGSSFVDLEGDIAILASGGGASLVAMDTLLSLGGKPANYTEYSGNPPREKVLRLTEIVLSKPNLKGLWIIGAVANFTDIYETLSGVIEGIRSIEKKTGKKFDFPIIIRRGGPREKEAFSMLKEVKDLNIKFSGREISIAESAKIVMEETKRYAKFSK